MLGDLHNVQLPDYVLAELYRNTLVASPDEVVAAPAEKKLQWLGENRKHICIVVDSKKDVYLPDGELSFLTSIMGACRLNLGDVAIVNYHKNNLDLKSLKEETAFTSLLVFGIEPAVFGYAGAEQFSILEKDGTTAIMAPPLGMMNSNTAEAKQLKTKLWQSLKQIFGV